MGQNSIYEEIGKTYAGGLTCIGVMERPAIILMDENGNKTMFAIGSPGHMALRPATAFDPDLIDTETSDMAGFVVLRHPLPNGGYVESDALPWSYVPAIQQGGENPMGWHARVRQLRARFDEAVGRMV